MRGIVDAAAYVPYWVLDLPEISAVLGTRPAAGRRSVAGHDEDTTTMGVEAARRLDHTAMPPSLFFATTYPAYADRGNANGVHSALGMAVETFAADVVGGVRSGLAAMRAALGDGGLAVLSDLRTGLPGSADEASGGDAAAALRFGDGEGVVLEWLAHEAATADFLDRWRVPGRLNSRVWEERFGVQEYLPLVADAVSRALGVAGVETPDLVAVLSPHRRTARTVAGQFDAGSLLALPGVGYTGAAAVGLAVCAALERAEPGSTVLLVEASDGADAIVLRATDAIADHTPRTPVATLVATRRSIDYPSVLTWRDMLRREPPRRPEPAAPAAPPASRNAGWKMRLVGTQCTPCGKVHAPPQRVCMSCGATDEMQEHSLADLSAIIATYTIDHLAYSLAPPVVVAIVDFEGGGRMETQITDVVPDEVAVGDEVEMTFRKPYTVDGIHNYFWKARPPRRPHGE